MMKFLEKLKKFKENLESSDKYQVFLVKSDFHRNNISKFFLNKLKLKYLFAFVFYTKPIWFNIFKWVGSIVADGVLIYIAVTGIFGLPFNPIMQFHKIIAYGLALYIPARIIKLAYRKISYEKRVRLSQQPQIIEEIKR